MDLQKHPTGYPPPSSVPVPVPGWYADPEHAGSERYWDGNGWSDQRRPAPYSGGGPGVPPPPTNGFAVAGLTCGIVGVVLALTPFTFFVAWILAIPGIVFGILGRKRVDANPSLGRKGLATAGLILGIITIVLTILWAVFITLAVFEVNQGFNDAFETFDTCVENPNDPICD